MLTRRFVVTALSLLAASAWANEPKVPVKADVVYAATAPGKVDPELQAMQVKLAERVKYGTMKTLATRRLELTRTPSPLELPNKKTAELAVESLKDDVATVRVKLPPAEATYTLARGKSLYLQGGAHDGGDLWLVLSMPK